MDYLRGAVHLLVFGFVALWIELALGRQNFWLPCGFLFAFYLACCRGWRFAALWSSFAAVVLNDLGGYSSLPGFILAVLWGQIWRRSGERSRLLVQIFPAAVLLAAAGALTRGFDYWRFGALNLHESALSLMGSVAAGALSFPVLLAVWDGCAERLGLSSYDSGIERVD
ncbi:MAG: hypothetical protein RL095_1038 [Verrucomicrobiota bacterium]|jgi:hypothetical protein